MISKVEPIRGKVARVLNSREVALNLGARDGVKLGMVFSILGDDGSEIIDPDTGEVLGSIDRPKVRVKVKALKDRISVAETFVSRRVNVGGTGLLPLTTSPLSELFEPPRWETRYVTLTTDEDTWEESDEAHVSTGDPVVQEFDIQ